MRTSILALAVALPLSACGSTDNSSNRAEPGAEDSIEATELADSTSSTSTSTSSTSTSTVPPSPNSARQCVEAINAQDDAVSQLFDGIEGDPSIDETGLNVLVDEFVAATSEQLEPMIEYCDDPGGAYSELVVALDTRGRSGGEVSAALASGFLKGFCDDSPLDLTGAALEVCRSAEQQAKQEAAQTVEQVVEDEEGWRYALTIAPIGLEPGPSPGRCIDAAPPGTNNVRYRLTITNLLDDRPSPWPSMVFGMNLSEDGSVIDSNAVDVESSGFTSLEVFPNAPESKCFLAFGVWPGSPPDGPQLLDAGGSQDFTIVAGPIIEPIPDELTLLVRFQAGSPGDHLDFKVPLAGG